MHRVFLLFRIAFGLAATVLYPASWAYANGIEQLQTFIAQVQTARGRFVQQQIETRAPHDSAHPQKPAQRSSTRVSSGTFLFARPGKFIWRYEQPYQQVLQSDGETFYIYDQDLNQVTLRPLDQAFSANPLTILFGRNTLEQNYALRPLAVRDGLEWLEMTPKKADESSYKKILIGFRNGQPASMELQDAFGNLTRLTLSALEKNPSLPERAFKLVVPPGADVIRE